jgi:hypothetical protein
MASNATPHADFETQVTPTSIDINGRKNAAASTVRQTARLTAFAMHDCSRFPIPI